jgi:protein-S-isoprenylcysteine O-methyltransferase Ste14
MTVTFAQSRMDYSATATHTAAAEAKAPLVHRSALVAWATHASGLCLSAFMAPGMIEDLASLGAGAVTLAVAFLAFMLSISLVQRHMGTALTASQTITPPKLTTSGIFRYSRNPIYLAFVMPLAALGTYSAAAAIVAIVAYIAAMNIWVIDGEEKELRVIFGADYDAYRASTPRWLLV